MPNIKAAIKWTRQTEKRAQRNLDAKTRLKTLFKKAAASGEAESARAVEAQYDAAASKGIIHANKAARKKSRLAKAIAATRSAPATPAKSSKKTGAKTGPKPGAKKKRPA